MIGRFNTKYGGQISGKTQITYLKILCNLPFYLSLKFQQKNLSYFLKQHLKKQNLINPSYFNFRSHRSPNPTVRRTNPIHTHPTQTATGHTHIILTGLANPTRRIRARGTGTGTLEHTSPIHTDFRWCAFCPFACVFDTDAIVADVSELAGELRTGEAELGDAGSFGAFMLGRAGGGWAGFWFWFENWKANII